MPILYTHHAAPIWIHPLCANMWLLYGCIHHAAPIYTHPLWAHTICPVYTPVLCAYIVLVLSVHTHSVYTLWFSYLYTTISAHKPCRFYTVTPTLCTNHEDSFCTHHSVYVLCWFYHTHPLCAQTMQILYVTTHSVYTLCWFYLYTPIRYTHWAFPIHTHTLSTSHVVPMSHSYDNI